MRRPIADTLAVLTATALTALAIFGGVQLASLALPTTGTAAAYSDAATSASVTAVANSGSLQYCPRTGCSATSCHGATGLPPGR
jgi:hypothetical protein